MENISLILSDLDGTLFHDDKSISDFSAQVIAEAQKKGILFGISTSRALVNARHYFGNLSPDVLITNGGGLVSCKGEKIYSCEFTKEEVRKLIDAAFRICGKDVIISVDNEHGLFCNEKEDLGDRYWTYTDFSDFNESAMKMCVETLDKSLVEKIASVVGLDQIDYLPFSDIPWYKMSKKNATKERAIENLCSYLNLPAEKIVAFGDDFNDIGMLKLCGKGVAMGNAIDEVKSVADEICLSNEEDGVARWIEEHLAFF